MEKLNLPDASVLVESLAKAKKGTKAKGVSVFLAPGIDLPTGGGYKNVDTLPPISEADNSMFYILPDGSLNYIKDNEWETISGGGGTSDFNNLDNRPKYNGSEMDGNTNIPEVKTYTAGENISISEDNVISVTSEDEPSFDYKVAELDYYSVWTKTLGAKNVVDCTVNSVDETKWNAWVEANPGVYTNNQQYFYWSDWEGCWKTSISGPMWMELRLSDEDMTNVVGINFTKTGSNPQMTISEIVDVDKSSQVNTVNVVGSIQWKKLGDNSEDGDFVGLGDNSDITVNKLAVKSLFARNNVPFHPDYFLANCANLTDIGILNDYEGSLTRDEVGNFAFVNTKVGQHWLANCQQLNPGAYSGGALLLQFVDSVIGDDFLISASISNEFGMFSLIGGGSEIGDRFMHLASSFLGYVDVGSLVVKSLGTQAFYDTHFRSLRFVSHFLSRLDKIPDYFCQAAYGITEIDGEINGPTEIGNGFFSGATSLNTPIVSRTIEKIGDNFLYGASSFNSLINMPLLENIGDNFMNFASAFTQNIEFPSLKQFGTNFMIYSGDSTTYRTIKFPNLLAFNRSSSFFEGGVGRIEFGQKNVSIVGEDTDSFQPSLGSYNDTSAMITNGVVIAGPGREVILSMFNTAPSAGYRNLVDGYGDSPEVLVMNGTPTTSTVGMLGQLYVDKDTNKVYICSAIDETIPSYTWTSLW